MFLRFRNIRRKAPGFQSLLTKVAGFTIIKKRLRHMYFPVNIVRCLRTAFFTEHLRWLLLAEIDDTQLFPYLFSKLF